MCVTLAQAETIAPYSAGPIASICCAPLYAPSGVSARHSAKRTSSFSPALSDSGTAAATVGYDKNPSSLEPPAFVAIGLSQARHSQHSA